MVYNPWVQDKGWWHNDPKLKQLQETPFRLPHLDPILDAIPVQEGIFSILGPRQVGKSTFLRLLVQKCIKISPPNRIFLLEGDEFESWRDLRAAMAGLIDSEKKEKTNLFIDEITSVPEWHRAVKTMADQGQLEKVFLVFTGSSSVSLKEGGELFPGRRGKHKKVDFELLPVPYRYVADRLSLEEYFTVGGFPWSINEYLRLNVLPEYVGEIYWSWLKGEFLKRGKSEQLLKHLVKALVRRLTTGFSNNTIAREIGITSHETAREYLQLLSDCFATCEVIWTDLHGTSLSPRKNRKHYPIDPLLFHLFHRGGVLQGLSPKDRLSPDMLGALAEAVVCGQLRHQTKDIFYWMGKKEIDFLPFFIEVKYQETVLPQEFNWFEKVAPKTKKLLVLTKNDRFKSGRVEALPLKDWLIAQS